MVAQFLVIVIFAVLVLTSKAQSNNTTTFTKEELERFKTLVSDKLEKELQNGPSEFIRKHHLAHLRLHLDFYKKELMKVVNTKDPSQQYRLPKIRHHIRKIEIALINEQKRINKKTQKYENLMKKRIDKTKKLFIEEAISLKKGEKGATEIRKTKEAFQDAIQKINLDLLKQKHPYNKTSKNSEISQNLSKIKLKTKLLMNKTIKKLAEKNGMSDLAEHARNKTKYLKKEYADFKNNYRQSLIGKVGRLRLKLLIAKQDMKVIRRVLSNVGELPRKREHALQQEKKKNFEILVLTKGVRRAERELRDAIRKETRKAKEKVMEVGEELVALSERSANRKNQVLNGLLKKESCAYLGDPKCTIWTKLNNKMITRDWREAERDDSKEAQKRFANIVKAITNDLGDEFNIQSKRLKFISDAERIHKDVTEEKESATKDFGLVKYGIEEIRRYIQETLVRARTIWAVRLAQGMLQRRAAMKRIEAEMAKLGKPGERNQVEFHWMAEEQMGKGINDIKQLNVELVLYALKELDAALKNVKTEKVDLQEEATKAIEDLKKLVKRGVVRARDVEGVNAYFERNEKGHGKKCERCFELAKTVRIGTFNGWKSSIIYKELMRKCKLYEEVGGTGTCEETAMGLMNMYSQKAFQLLRSSAFKMCEKLKYC
ncbi:hypothetical protein EIN_176730 [Entamoeba invadens IP1]|uniref:hypothetical protein n=1 Tax=Entamoeba invadens IP1 TaxID=370355 RepID=UPI0002C3D9AE|nr:hypothetical protein EIN_176730 [Entamoeba invadens IP1]ELP93846.1 hypothetical protein EIN_176730 [Entamoeba invadens IP1]|eukprot:XP_004260617.1 hypothetical protein EIN_176730 [Entamoeba invadens IP1]